MKTNHTKTLIALATTHWMVDCFGGMWPIFKYLVDLDLERAGLILALATLVGAGAQPVFGLFSDRGHQRRLILWGTGLAGMGMLLGPVSLLANSIGENAYYWILFFVLTIQTLGAGMYHPAATSTAGNISHDRRSTLVSAFIACGMFGMAVSHGFFSMAFDYAGAHTEWLLIMTVALVLLASVWCRPRLPATDSSIASRRQKLKSIATPLTVLFLFHVAMSGMFHGFAFLMPEFLELQSCPKWMIRGGGYFFYVIGSAVMMLLGGPLADRLGRVRLLSIFTIAAVVILYTIMLIPTQAWGVYGVLLFLAGGFCGATNPMGVAIGQRLAPECASTISGILMGLAWAVASPVFWLIGILAERSGVVPALRWVGSLGFLGILAVSAFILLNRRLKIAA